MPYTKLTDYLKLGRRGFELEYGTTPRALAEAYHDILQDLAESLPLPLLEDYAEAMKKQGVKQALTDIGPLGRPVPAMVSVSAGLREAKDATSEIASVVDEMMSWLPAEDLEAYLELKGRLETELVEAPKRRSVEPPGRSVEPPKREPVEAPKREPVEPGPPIIPPRRERT